MKVFKYLFGFFIIVAFFRALNGASFFDINDLLYYLQDFEFSSSTIDSLREFYETPLKSYLPPMTSGIPTIGILAESVTGFFRWLVDLFTTFYTTGWNLLSDTVRTLYSVLRTALYIFGFTA